MKRSVLLFALCIYIFAGCNKEPQNTLDQEECQVEVSFSNDFTKSLLKSTTGPEKTITNVILFGVDASGNFAGKYSIDHQPATTESMTILKKVKTLYAIANPTPEIESLATPNKAALDILFGIFTGTNALVTPLLMGGSGDVSVSGSNYSAAIQLIRTVAKVTFNSTETGLVITSVTAKNVPNQAYVFKQASVAVPASVTRFDYANTVAGTDTDPIYVAESTNTNVSNTTTFVVNGTYDSKTASYEITLKTGSTNLAIERNKHYSVDVKAVSTTSCTISITTPDWDPVNAGEYEIPYEEFH